jgi:ATP-binding protein involved in chromosome partitioning
MPTTAEMMSALEKVYDPELGRSIVELKMVHDLTISPEGDVRFTLALTVPGCPMREQMRSAAGKALMALPGVRDVQIDFRAMSEEERKEVFGQLQPPGPRLNEFNKISRVIAVMSGKGGVGKSSVTGLLACALNRQRQKVGILDADVTGPSIPRLFGLPPGGLRGTDQGMLPAISRSGIRVVSTNLLLKDEDQPVVWRGPMIAGAIKQFWTDALWGKLDTLLVDLPPGTSDAALSVVNSLPLNGVILVTTPQDLAGMVVRKAIRMLNELKVPIIGLVENFSYFVCPDCGARHEIFGPSHAAETAAAAGLMTWVRLPVDPAVADQCDNGQVELINFPAIQEVVSLLA